MDAQTLEHQVLGPGNFAENVLRFVRMDSIAAIQARRTEKGIMRNQGFYTSDAVAYSIKDGEHVLELYDLNDRRHFPDKSEFVRTLRKESYYFAQLPDLEDTTRVINLSDEKFNRFVTRDNNNYSHITFNISDVIKGKNHFEETYGTEATKLFTAMHGEDVYRGEGIKGRFRENPITTNICFQNKEVTAAKLDGKEEGTKVLRGACLYGLGEDSGVCLGDMFSGDDACVSGVVEKSGEAGAMKKDNQRN